MSKTHWRQLRNPNYIGAYALPDGNDLTVTIISAAKELVTGEGGRGEDCTVVQLEGFKPLILNVTNGLSIQRLYGPYIEEWAGKQITLCAAVTKLKGETVECIRIRPQVMQDNQDPPITKEQFASIRDAMTVANVTEEALCKRAVISKLEELPQSRIMSCLSWLKKQAAE